jgi:hypothetical protein
MVNRIVGLSIYDCCSNITHHLPPASHQIRLGEGRIRDSAKDLLIQMADTLPPEAYSAAMERGQKFEMDEMIVELVGPRDG